LFAFEGMKRNPVDAAGVGELSRLPVLKTLTLAKQLLWPIIPKPLPVIAVDEPTISMIFGVTPVLFLEQKANL
jgi:GTP-binding protein